MDVIEIVRAIEVQVYRFEALCFDALLRSRQAWRNRFSGVFGCENVSKERDVIANQSQVAFPRQRFTRASNRWSTNMHSL